MKKLENGSFEIDLNVNVIDLDGKVMPNSNVGKTVANHLSQQSEGDHIKYWTWAVILHKGEKLVLDRSDKDHLKDLLLKAKNFLVILKVVIDNAFTEEKEPKMVVEKTEE